MTKSNTKRALVASVLSIVVCLSMLVGSTFAWFTDSVSVVGNKIQSGTLDIELWRNYYGSEYDNTNEVNITGSTDPIFNSDLWEPGYLAFANLTVKNVGTLAAKIKANLVPVGEVGKLAEVIDVYVVEHPLSNDPYSAWGTPSSFTVRDLIEGFEFEPVIPDMGTDYYSKLVTHVGTLKEVFEGGLDLMPEKIIAAGNNYQVNIALKMQETAGNEYQNQTAGDFDIRILATQATVEEDYFDNQYDKDAKFPYIATSQADLDAAVTDAAVTDAAVISMTDGTYTLPALTDKNITFVGTENVVIDTTSGMGSTNNATLAFEGVTVNFKEGGLYGTNGFTHSEKVVYKDCVINGTQFLYSEAEFINCTFNVEGDAYAVWTYGSTKATFTGCTFNTSGKAILVYTEAETHAEINVKDCTFNCDGEGFAKAAVEVGASAYSADTTYNVTIENSTADAGFTTNKSDSNLWGNKNSMDEAHLTVVVK